MTTAAIASRLGVAPRTIIRLRQRPGCPRPEAFRNDAAFLVALARFGAGIRGASPAFLEFLRRSQPAASPATAAPGAPPAAAMVPANHESLGAVVLRAALPFIEKGRAVEAAAALSVAVKRWQAGGGQ